MSQSKSSNIKYSRFESEKDLAKQRQLFANAFPETIGTPLTEVAHYTWKFKKMPHTPTSFEYAAFTGPEDAAPEKLVGYYAALPFSYSINGRILRAGMVCDVMTHSDVRGRGVFTGIGRSAIADMTSEGLDFLTGYPIRPEVLPGHLKVGWQVAFELPMYFRFRKLTGFLKPRGFGVFTPIMNLGVSCINFLIRLSERNSNRKIKVQTISIPQLANDKRFPEFFKQWSRQFPNHLIKTADFLRWRFSAPHTDYAVLVAESGTKILGISIVRAAELKGVKCAVVLDHMTLGVQSDLESALLGAIDTYAATQSCEASTLMMSRANAKQHRLLRHGFLTSPFKFKLILRTLSDKAKAEELMDELKWHLMWIDSDDL